MLDTRFANHYEICCRCTVSSRAPKKQVEHSLGAGRAIFKGNSAVTFPVRQPARNVAIFSLGYEGRSQISLAPAARIVLVRAGGYRVRSGLGHPQQRCWDITTWMFNGGLNMADELYKLFPPDISTLLQINYQKNEEFAHSDHLQK